MLVVPLGQCLPHRTGQTWNVSIITARSAALRSSGVFWSNGRLCSRAQWVAISHQKQALKSCVGGKSTEESRLVASLQHRYWELAADTAREEAEMGIVLPKSIAPLPLPEGPTGSSELRTDSSYKLNGKGGLSQHSRPRKPVAPTWLNNWTVSPCPVKLDSNEGN